MSEWIPEVREVRVRENNWKDKTLVWCLPISETAHSILEGLCFFIETDLELAFKYILRHVKYRFASLTLQKCLGFAYKIHRSKFKMAGAYI